MENLGIDYKLLIAQGINFAILFLIIGRFVAKPFTQYLHAEKKKDEEREKISQELQTKHERMIEEEEEWRKKMKREQEKILAETKKTAEKLKAELTEEAKREADTIIAKAKAQMDSERETFYKELKSHVTDVSIYVIERALKDYLTTDVQKKLTEHVVANVKKGGLHEN